MQTRAILSKWHVICCFGFHSYSVFGLVAGCALMRNKTPLSSLDILVPSLTSEHEVLVIVVFMIKA
jgi:hypothetical protein